MTRLPDRAEMPATIVDFWAACEAFDNERLAELFAEEAVSHDPVGEPPVTTREAHMELFVATAALFEDIAFDWTPVYAVGNRIGIRWTARATLAESGEPATLEGLDVFDLDAAGLIAEHWGFFAED